jgi:hypothetical protein
MRWRLWRGWWASWGEAVRSCRGSVGSGRTRRGVGSMDSGYGSGCLIAAARSEARPLARWTGNAGWMRVWLCIWRRV